MTEIKQGHAITEGVIWKQLLRFFFPILFGSFFQQLYSMTDAVILGQFVGKEALAAIDSTSSMIRLLINLFVGISTGATILVAQQYGARDMEGLSDSVHTAMAFAAVGGAVIMVLGLVLTPLGLHVMQIPADISGDAGAYVRIYFTGMIASMLYNMGAGILRAIGDARRPLYFLIASTFVNIGLDLLFVAVFKLGVAGAALATVASQVVSAALVLWVLLRSREGIRLDIKKIRLKGTVVRRVLKTGLPIGIQSAMYPLSNMMIQSSVNRLGTTVIAAWAVCGKLDAPIWLVIDALSISGSTFVAQNFGAGYIERVFKSIRVCIGIALVIVLPLSAIYLLWGGQMSRLFIQDAQVAHLVGRLFTVYAPFFFTFIFGEMLAGAIRGTGETIRPMILTLLGTCALRILWVLVVVPYNPAIEWIVVSYPITWVITSAMFIIYYVRYKRRVLLPMKMRTHPA